MNKDKLETINKRIDEQQERKQELQASINEWTTAIHQTIESYAVGEAEQSDIDDARNRIKSMREQISDIDDIVAKLEAVKRDALIEYVPYVRRQRDKKRKEIAQEVKEAVKTAHKARQAYVEALADIGKAQAKMPDADKQLDEIEQTTGQKIERDRINAYVPPVYPKTTTVGLYASQVKEADAIGISEATQEQAVKNGTIPIHFRQGGGQE